MSKRLPSLVTVGDVLQHCEAALRDSDVHFGHGTDNARDEAVQLVLVTAELPLDCNEEILALPLEHGVVGEILERLKRRVKKRIPLPYLIGSAWFAGLRFHCDRRAIIPRSPIAELILHEFVPWYAGPPPRRALDLCCGGGCIGLSVAHYHPHMSVDLVDLDGDALALARENAHLLDLEDHVRILQSDLFAALGNERYDLILCNPPYVDAQDLAAMPAEYLSEPEIALASGTDGLDLTRRILAAAGDHLEPQGLLILEVGHTWPALEAAFPDFPFTWVDFEHGGEGVCVITAREWQDYSESFRG
ncbi:MAG: 50S ribosomal protein L3 N(5)-glutamine methyltransferase [Halioglobus sp.]|nr:50S ribosomal protein L3 N(5)-glutamine methyltransferase [Halioglobus sp.]